MSNGFRHPTTGEVEILIHLFFVRERVDDRRCFIFIKRSAACSIAGKTHFGDWFAVIILQLVWSEAKAHFVRYEGAGDMSIKKCDEHWSMPTRRHHDLEK